MARSDLLVGVALGVWLSACAVVAYSSYGAVTQSSVPWAAYTMWFGTMAVALPVFPRSLCVAVEQRVHRVDAPVVALAAALAVALAYTDLAWKSALTVLALFDIAFVVGGALCAAVRKVSKASPLLAYVDSASDDD